VAGKSLRVNSSKGLDDQGSEIMLAGGPGLKITIWSKQAQDQNVQDVGRPIREKWLIMASSEAEKR